MPISITRTPFNDFEALQDVVQDSRSEIMQLGRGQMQGAIDHLELGDAFSVAAGSFNRAMRASGILSEKRWMLGLLTATDGPAIGHGQDAHAGDLHVAAPNAERHFNFQNNSGYVAMLVTPQEIEDYLAAYPGAFDLLIKHQLSILHATPTRAKASVASGTMLLETLVRDGATMPDDVVAYHKHSLLEWLTAPIRDAVHYRGAHLAAPDALVRKVIDYQKQSPHLLHVAELAKIFAVHPRKLHRAFHDFVGMGPSTYTREKRLNEAHTALRQDGPGVTVTKVARDLGFVDLGRFAAAYHHKFGELPRETLKRKLKLPPPSIITALAVTCMLRITHALSWIM